MCVNGGHRVSARGREAKAGTARLGPVVTRRRSRRTAMRVPAVGDGGRPGHVTEPTT
jgi:hypothetical protein